MNLQDIVSIVNTLRAEGCAVTVLTPEDLRGADPDLVEDLMVERGHNAITDLADEGQDEIEPEVAPLQLWHLTLHPADSARDCSSLLVFTCWAEDEDHACEQAEDMYPGCEIVTSTEIRS